VSSSPTTVSFASRCAATAARTADAAIEPPSLWSRRRAGDVQPTAATAADALGDDASVRARRVVTSPVTSLRPSWTDTAAGTADADRDRRAPAGSVTLPEMIAAHRHHRHSARHTAGIVPDVSTCQ
jgi:hypothetical protein